MLRVESTHGGSVSYVKLEGIVEGTIAAQLLAGALRERTAVLDLRGIEAVREAGLPGWRAMLEAAEAKTDRLLAIECSPAVVDRLNADPTFLGRAEVVSVRAALRCEHCDRETQASVPVDQPVTADDLWFSCALCDAVLNLQADPSDYLAFTHKVQIASLDADMASIVHRATQPASVDEDSEEETGPVEESGVDAAPMAAEAPPAVAEEWLTIPKAEPQASPAAGDTARADKTSKAEQKTETNRQITAEAESATRTARIAKRAAAKPVEAKSVPTVLDPVSHEAEAKPAAETTREIETIGRAPAAVPDTTSLADTISVAVPDLGRRAESRAKQKRRRTDPALPTSVKETTDLNRRAPMEESRLEFLRRRLGEQRPALIAALIGWLWSAALLAILVFSGPVGIPPEELLAFHGALQQEQIPVAEQLLVTHKENIPPPLAEVARAAIDSRRKQVRERLQAEAQTAYDQQAFGEALAKAQQAIELAPDNIEVSYLIADSLRQLGQLPEASPHYARFVELVTDDPRLDDALFWQGEAALASNKPEDARALFVRVNAMDTSNFKRSAEKRLSELAALAPAPPPAPEPPPVPEQPSP